MNANDVEVINFKINKQDNYSNESPCDDKTPFNIRKSGEEIYSYNSPNFIQHQY